MVLYWLGLRVSAEGCDESCRGWFAMSLVVFLESVDWRRFLVLVSLGIFLGGFELFLDILMLDGELLPFLSFC